MIFHNYLNANNESAIDADKFKKNCGYNITVKLKKEITTNNIF